MNAYLLPDGKMMVPKRIEGPDGEIGDTFVEITKDDPLYARWIPFIERGTAKAAKGVRDTRLPSP
jgi:hypothetical protein